MALIESNATAVEYIGPIPTSSVPRELVNANALLLTPAKNYVTKGFPTKLGEYFASGTPVICTSIDNLKECLSEKEVYFAVPGDVGSIASAMSELAENPEEAAIVGRNGRDYVGARFTMKSHLSQLMEFLKI